MERIKQEATTSLRSTQKNVLLYQYDRMQKMKILHICLCQTIAQKNLKSMECFKSFTPKVLPITFTTEI